MEPVPPEVLENGVKEDVESTDGVDRDSEEEEDFMEKEQEKTLIEENEEESTNVLDMEVKASSEKKEVSLDEYDNDEDDDDGEDVEEDLSDEGDDREDVDDGLSGEDDDPTGFSTFDPMSALEPLSVVLENVRLEDGTKVNVYRTPQDLEETIRVIENLLTPVSDYTRLNTFWPAFLEQRVDPSGWSALHCSSQDMFSDGPSENKNVVVTISAIDFKNYVATGKVGHIDNETGYVEEIETEDKYFELINLYPLEKQKNILHLEDICRYLHVFRTFRYIHLPWDPELSRLFLSEAIEERSEFLLEVVPTLHVTVRTKVFDLMRQARALQPVIDANLRNLEEELEIEERQRLELLSLELQFKMCDLENEYKKLQNPIFWPVLLSFSGDRKKFPKNELFQENVIVVIKDLVCNAKILCAVQDFTEKKFGMSTNFRLEGDLQVALSKSNVGSTIVVGPGNHAIIDLGNLEMGGTIVGLFEDDPPFIESKECDDSWLVLSPNPDDSVTLMDVNLRLLGQNQSETTIAILLKSGTLCLKNVNIIGCHHKSTNQKRNTIGIKALKETTLEGRDVYIKEFTTGISTSDGVKGKFESSELSLCHIAIRAEDRIFHSESLRISDCDSGVMINLEANNSNDRDTGVGVMNSPEGNNSSPEFDCEFLT